ncbi:glucose-1-phosphate thymidylyltransferase RfbA [Hyphomicrobiales bacterium]|nr:glucose-1-phosphate thymidylyltransferase RfbA [Hyphomicrobiales bacterium]
MLESSLQKGIILAGGAGTRLYPVTKVVSKQLLPIYNKPMIYYPLSTLINAGIKEIMIISTPDDQMLFKRLLGDGSQWKVNFKYIIQEKPEGIAQALILAESWLQGSPVTLILGDNLFFGPNMFHILKNAIVENKGATLFGYEVDDPGRFGVVDFDNDFNAISIEEKPLNPKSNWAVTGLYVFNRDAVDYTKSLKKSDRSEYEITDLNKIYLENKNLKVVLLDDSYSWLDTGTHESLLEASNFVRNTELKNKISVADLKVL